MEDVRKIQLGSVESVEMFLAFLGEQGALHEHLRLKAMKENDERICTVVPLLNNLRDSLESQCMLARAGKVRDSFVTARTILELVINSAFILLSGVEVANPAKVHAAQKAHRDVQRHVEIIGDPDERAWPAEVERILPAEIRSAMDKFTSKKGREITSWTPETADEKINLIGAKSNAAVYRRLRHAFFFVYRHASEIAHGTVFGSLFMLGLLGTRSIPESPDELEQHVRRLLAVVTMETAFAINVLVEILAAEVDDVSYREAGQETIERFRRTVSECIV